MCSPYVRGNKVFAGTLLLGAAGGRRGRGRDGWGLQHQKTDPISSPSAGRLEHYITNTFQIIILEYLL